MLEACLMTRDNVHVPYVVETNCVRNHSLLLMTDTDLLKFIENIISFPFTDVPFKYNRPTQKTYFSRKFKSEACLRL